MCLLGSALTGFNFKVIRMDLNFVVKICVKVSCRQSNSKTGWPRAIICGTWITHIAQMCLLGSALTGFNFKVIRMDLNFVVKIFVKVSCRQPNSKTGWPRAIICDTWITHIAQMCLLGSALTGFNFKVIRIDFNFVVKICVKVSCRQPNTKTGWPRAIIRGTWITHIAQICLLGSALTGFNLKVIRMDLNFVVKICVKVSCRQPNSKTGWPRAIIRGTWITHIAQMYELSMYRIW